jgi:outer membrane protein assembly factor BamB
MTIPSRVLANRCLISNLALHRGQRIWCFLIAACLLICNGLGRRSQAVDWYRWRGPDLNGTSSETGWSTQWPAEGPKQLWKASVGIGFSSVAVSQGRVLTMGNAGGQDTVFCFNADSGEVLWKQSYSCGLRPQYYEGGTSSTPTIDEGRAYTLGKEGQLYCFDLASGNVLWHKSLAEDPGVPMPRWGFAGSPLVLGNRLLLNAGSAGTALDKMTGKVLWSSGNGAAGYATPVPATVGTQQCILVFSSKALVGTTVQEGHELWRFPWVTHWDLNIADPIVDGNRVFLSTFDQGAALLSISEAGTTTLWRNKSLANHFNSSILYQGLVYGIDGNTDKPPAEFHCLDFTSGELKWKYSGLGFGAFMIADGKLIVLSEKGELVIAPASGAGFKAVARAQVLGGKCWITPVLSNGHIYCRNAQGVLVCLDVSGKS